MDTFYASSLTEPPAAVIFDLDGTLIDSLPDIAAVSNAAMRSFELAEHSEDDYRDMIGWGLGELARLALEAHGLQNPTTDELTHRIEELYEQHPFEHGLVYEGIPDVLSRLEKAGIRCAVLTNKRHSVAVQAVARAFPGVSFAYVRGDKEGQPRKPDPATVREVLDALHVAAEKTVLVGDSDVDIRTAANMKLFSVGVAWGYRGREHLIEAGADLVIDRPDELIAALGIQA